MDNDPDKPTPESTNRAKTTCLEYSEEDGKFTKSHDLARKRVDHVSWLSPEGVLLMGGADDDEEDQDPPTSRSAELLNDDGTSTLMDWELQNIAV